MNIKLTHVFIVSLLLSSSIPPVLAGELNAKCLLQIDGKTYMNDRCQFKSNSDSDYFSDLRIQITCPNGMDASKSSCSGAEEKVTKPGVFGYLFRKDGVASLCWNARTMRKATPCFQGLRRSGACWSNPRAKTTYNPEKSIAVKFCAWSL